jgi:predicted dehydrogenase
VREPVEVEKGEPLRIELESFLQCARDGLRPKVTGLAAADALDLALEITRKIEEADPRSKN